MNTTIANLSKLLDSLKSRKRNAFIAQTRVSEWAAIKVSTTVAGAAGGKEAAKYQKEVAKSGFPWKDFGFPEAEPDFDDDYDEFDDESAEENKEKDEFSYIFGNGNMKGAMRDNSRIGNVDLALGQVMAGRV